MFPLSNAAPPVTTRFLDCYYHCNEDGYEWQIKPLSFRRGESDWPCVESIGSLFFQVQGLKQRLKGYGVFYIAAIFMLNKMEWSKNSNKFTVYCIVFFQRVML